MSEIYRLLCRISICLFIGITAKSKCSLIDDFWRQRNETISAENLSRVGGKIVLNKDEQTVNKKLMQFKYAEINNGESTGLYPPSQHFFVAKEAIENSDVFQFIQKMPKGGALHLHDSSMASVHWLINQTYSELCYMCFKDGKPSFKFMNKARPDPECDQQWMPVNYYRKTLYKSAAIFDEMLYRNMTMVTEDPEKAYPTQGKLWEHFSSCFAAEGGILNYAPVFRAYYKEALQEFYNDNVQYMEFRVLLLETYELNGTTHNKDYLIKMYQEVTQDFMKSHPDFIGAKLIYSSPRHVNESFVLTKVKETMVFMNKYPGFVLGFDLVGREDDGYPLTNFLNALLYPQSLSPPVNVPYFFHAGETDWEGTDIDDNVVSAILLNSSRIGHGFALTKHPLFKQMIKSKGITVEVNPVSNQVLGLVSDLRNHPGSVWLSEDVRVVISSDDPGLWGALPLSHDFYEAFMGLAGKESDLRTLKQLAMNSILYSAMTTEEKGIAMKKWQQRWETFISKMIMVYEL